MRISPAMDRHRQHHQHELQQSEADDHQSHLPLLWPITQHEPAGDDEHREILEADVRREQQRAGDAGGNWDRRAPAAPAPGRGDRCASASVSYVPLTAFEAARRMAAESRVRARALAMAVAAIAACAAAASPLPVLARAEVISVTPTSAQPGDLITVSGHGFGATNVSVNACGTP